MKAKELMIGDLLLHKGQPIKVEEILIDGINPMWDGSESYGNEAWYDEDLQPILLTYEILEKNGFNISQSNKEREYYIGLFPEDKNYNLELTYFKGVVCWTKNGDEYTIAELKYVHELQHALRLCGIEKEIVL